MILQSLIGLPAFLAYFCTAFAAVIIYLVVYTLITPHDEFALIRANVPGAAVALGLSMLGFALPGGGHGSSFFSSSSSSSGAPSTANTTSTSGWWAAGAPAGLSVRESAGWITTNSSRFLPHAIV